MTATPTIVPSAPPGALEDRVARNEFNEKMSPGDAVERWDNFKRGGKVLAVNHRRGTRSMLVRWPNLDDCWMDPRDLHPAAA